jgi:hypothetical protein
MGAQESGQCARSQFQLWARNRSSGQYIDDFNIKAVNMLTLFAQNGNIQ